MNFLTKSMITMGAFIAFIMLANYDSTPKTKEERRIDIVQEKMDIAKAKIKKEKNMCYTIAFSRAKKSSKFPSTFDVSGIVNTHKGNGIYYTELEFTSKNGFGFEVPQVVTYKCDFPNDKVSIVSLENR